MPAHDLVENPVPGPGEVRDLLFGILREPKMKCAASPGGTLHILWGQSRPVNGRGQAIRDSLPPQAPILKENC